MECFCERSVLAMTYPPNNLNSVMAEKGVLQRMLLYVWEVPEFLQHKMRTEQNLKAGTIEEVNQPLRSMSRRLWNCIKSQKKDLMRSVATLSRQWFSQEISMMFFN